MGSIESAAQCSPREAVLQAICAHHGLGTGANFPNAIYSNFSDSSAVKELKK